MKYLIRFSIFLLILFLACEQEENPLAPVYPDMDRLDTLPGDIVKQSPETDEYPPILHVTEFETPVPLDSTINTAGAEDSPFILPDGQTLYFFFTPDVRIPAEKQVLDEVTGVWVSRKSGETWQPAERVWLQDAGKLALDGAVCVQGEEMWFASAREGYTGVNIFTARSENGTWKNWQYAGDRLMKEIRIGEVHLHHDDLYFHSDRTGGKGDFDIWKTTRQGNEWSDPINIDIVNTANLDGFPYVSSDGNELWFTRMVQGTPGILRSTKTPEGWSTPELIVSQFAGEPTLDDAGNLYFVHHYYHDGVMIEADIYVAQKK